MNQIVKRFGADEKEETSQVDEMPCADGAGSTQIGWFSLLARRKYSLRWLLGPWPKFRSFDCGTCSFFLGLVRSHCAGKKKVAAILVYFFSLFFKKRKILLSQSRNDDSFICRLNASGFIVTLINSFEFDGIKLKVCHSAKGNVRTNTNRHSAHRDNGEFLGFWLQTDGHHLSGKSASGAVYLNGRWWWPLVNHVT